MWQGKFQNITFLQSFTANTQPNIIYNKKTLNTQGSIQCILERIFFLYSCPLTDEDLMTFMRQMQELEFNYEKIG